MKFSTYKNNSVPTDLLPFIKDGTIIATAPGRINLIGEHTDYNNGFVLPATINKRVFIALNARTDDKIILYALNRNEKFECITASITKTNTHWANYLLGVVAQFQQKNIVINGFEAAVISDVPMGAGLSSSAALECAMAGALNKYLQSCFSKIELCKIAQKAEHEYAGVLCGIMDQFASIFGKKNNVICLDCGSMDYEYKPFVLKNHKIILLDTSIKHHLASSEYNVRRQQCEQGVKWVQEKYHSIQSLRGVSLEMLQEQVQHRDKKIFDRCKYVVQENERLLNACIDLENDDIVSFGKKMFETHDGLSKLYEVSCKELDFLVAHAAIHPDIIGSRMMGGGFGGCTINIIKTNEAEAAVQTIKNAYEKYTKLNLKIYEVSIEDGLQVFN